MKEQKQFDVNRYRQDFPILNTKVNGKPLVYLDNAASTHMPQQVIDRIEKYYNEQHSNIHRSIHSLAQTATNEYEAVREQVRELLNARYTEEIIFTKGTTDSINLLAYVLGSQEINSGDEILVTEMEHHANIVPWQVIAQEKGAIVQVVPVDDHGELVIEEFERLISEKTKIFSFVHVSNSMGIVNPVHQLIKKSREYNCYIHLDCAQAIQHIEIDLNDLDVDFLSFSAHKLYGPTGVGVLFGKKEILDYLPPYQTGGEMISKVSFEGTTFNNLPYKYEAGTPNIAGVVGLGESIRYINELGLSNISSYEHDLYNYTLTRLKEIDKFNQIGQSSNQVSSISFLIDGIHPTDITTLLDINGVATRTGHHCTQPLMRRFGLAGTTRASLAFYNTKEEVNLFVESLKKIINAL